MSSQKAEAIRYRQIRAQYDSTTITVYQAYCSAIAIPAVQEQKLNASPAFRMTRMTWIKPSWCWMMYRAGYSYKDAGQERILAIKMSQQAFSELLSHGVLAERGNGENKATVKVQWDPERNMRLERLDHRSIQIGIPAVLCDKWINEWIVGIEDVTEKAKGLKAALEAEPNVSEGELGSRGLLSEERPFEVSEELKKLLQVG